MTQKNTEIEVLRSLAIGLVICAHFNGFLFPSGIALFSYLDQYFFFGVGVDLFFCISGYVVAGSLLPRLDNATSSKNALRTVLAFWVRRIFRLLPAAWFWVTVSLAASYVFNSFNSFHTPAANWESLATVFTFTANLEFLHGLSAGPNIVHWSLSLEEQFYAVLPLTCLFVRGNVRVAALAAGIVWLFFQQRSGGSPGWFIRIDGMLWGVLIYEANQRGLARALRCRLSLISRLRTLRWASVIALLVVAAALPSALTAHTDYTYGWVALVMAALVFLASLDAGAIAASPGRMVLWVASRSYSIYLAHIPVFRFVTEAIAWTPLVRGYGLWPFQIVLMCVALSLTAIFAEISYQWVEAPFRRLGVDFASRLSGGRRKLIQRGAQFHG